MREWRAAVFIRGFYAYASQLAMRIQNVSTISESAVAIDECFKYV